MAAEKKIAYIVSTFPWIRETFIARELIELERRGMSFVIVSLKNNPQKVGRAETPQSPVVYLPFFFSWPLLRSMVRNFFASPIKILRVITGILTKLLRTPSQAIKFLVVLPKTIHLIDRLRDEGVCHIHAHWATIPTTCALFISSMTGMRYSFSAHAWDIFASGNEVLLPEKIGRADRVFTCTAFNRAKLQRMARGRDSVELMYHGIDLQHYHYNDEQKRPTVSVLAGGSLSAQKGLDVLINAKKILKAQGVEFDLTIFGDGEEKANLIEMVKAADLRDTVCFVGLLTHRQVIGVMQESDIFVMPSLRAKRDFIDGLPNVVGEAMACGAAVVASDFSGIPEIVDDGVDGLLVPPGETEDLANAVRRLVEDRTLRKELAKRGRQKVESKFDIKANIEPMSDYFASVLGG